MANFAQLKIFIDAIKGDSVFGTGIVGATSNLQNQTIELKRAFALWYREPSNDTLKEAFKESLFVAHTLSVITDVELQHCQDLMEA